MARPRGAPKPQARNRRPRRPENRENLASLTSEVLRLRLQALNLPLTGARRNWLNAYKTPPNRLKGLWSWQESRPVVSARAGARANRE